MDRMTGAEPPRREPRRRRPRELLDARKVVQRGLHRREGEGLHRRRRVRDARARQARAEGPRAAHRVRREPARDHRAQPGGARARVPAPPRLRHARGREGHRARRAPPPRSSSPTRPRPRRSRASRSSSASSRSSRCRKAGQSDVARDPQGAPRGPPHDRDSHGAARQRAARGHVHSGFKGQGLAFREVRPYQPGDDVRTIDWNVSARMNDTFVKVFVEEREMTVMLVVDLSASERFGTRRAPKARVAAEVARAARVQRHQATTTAWASSSSPTRSRSIVPPKKGKKHVMRVVREILGFDAGAASARARARRRRAAAARRGDGPEGRARGARRRGAAAERRVRRERLLRHGLRARAGARGGQARRHPRGARRPARRASCPTWASRRSRTSRAARPSSSTRATRACARTTRAR